MAFGTCRSGNNVFNFGSRVDIFGSEKVFRELLHVRRLLWDYTRGSCVLGSEMSSSLAALGLLFCRNVRGLMPIGSRVERCVRPECLECIIYPSPGRKIPYNITLPMWSHCTGFMLQRDRGIAR